MQRKQNKLWCALKLHLSRALLAINVYREKCASLSASKHNSIHDVVWDALAHLSDANNHRSARATQVQLYRDLYNNILYVFTAIMRLVVCG